ncbi:hypothetical protein [Stenotrophomonas sp. B1-1]|uniref:hypothetical protein n=1 Tax=Stenotrophomonas sp. B1-1 TaxID=2710648 RepID=UPI0013D985BF|nr:hypothetical protein [Stenotrophomonas sp. B1-1]
MEMPAQAFALNADRYARRAGVGWLIAVVCLAVVTWTSTGLVQFNPTDHVAWKGDWQTAKHCLEQTVRLPCEGMSKFPLAYLVNAGITETSSGLTAVRLATLNLFCLLLPLAALWFTRGGVLLLRAGWAYVLALALSPLPMFYVLSGALEVQAGVFCGLYIAAFVQVLTAPNLQPARSSWWMLGLAGFLFPLYKDTLALFMGAAMALLLLVAIRPLHALYQHPAGRSRLRCAFAVAVGPVLLSQVLAAAYSWFKYGVPLPKAYMAEAELTTPALAKSAEFFFGSIFSPNGGILVFWGGALLMGLVGWRIVGLVPRRQALLAALTVLILSAVAFARWWAPFGWDAWGDRLLLPAALALLISAMCCLRILEPEQASNRSWVGAALASIPLLVCSSYYMAVPYLSPKGEAMTRSLWPGPACVTMRDALATEAADQGLAFWKGNIYYQCARERMLHVPAP